MQGEEEEEEAIVKIIPRNYFIIISLSSIVKASQLGTLIYLHLSHIKVHSFILWARGLKSLARPGRGLNPRPLVK